MTANDMWIVNSFIIFLFINAQLSLRIFAGINQNDLSFHIENWNLRPLHI